MTLYYYVIMFIPNKYLNNKWRVVMVRTKGAKRPERFGRLKEHIEPSSCQGSKLDYLTRIWAKAMWLFDQNVRDTCNSVH